MLSLLIEDPSVCKSIVYDVSNRVASYTDSGKIINETIHYKYNSTYSQKKIVSFKDSVRIVNPNMS